MKERIEKKIKELEELYDWNLQKSEDMNYINTWSILEQRLHDLKIEINTYKKVLEMLQMSDKDYKRSVSSLVEEYMRETLKELKKEK